MSPLKRAARQKAPPVVVKVRRIKHATRPPHGPLVRRAGAARDAAPIADPQA